MGCPLPTYLKRNATDAVHIRRRGPNAAFFHQELRCHPPRISCVLQRICRKSGRQAGIVLHDRAQAKVDDHRMSGSVNEHVVLRRSYGLFAYDISTAFGERSLPVSCRHGPREELGCGGRLDRRQRRTPVFTFRHRRKGLVSASSKARVLIHHSRA